MCYEKWTTKKVILFLIYSNKSIVILPVESFPYFLNKCKHGCILEHLQKILNNIKILIYFHLVGFKSTRHLLNNVEIKLLS